VLKQHSQFDFYIASSLKQQSFDVFDIDMSFTQIYILVNGGWTNYTEWSKSITLSSNSDSKERQEHIQRKTRRQYTYH
jgi:hypothetical protein